jgi:hypothetical protein
LALAATCVVGAFGATPAWAGNFLATGHDIDDHSTTGGQEHFLEVATNFVRAGAPDPTKPVLAVECSGLVSSGLDAAFGAGVVPRQSVCPSADPAAFNALALTTANYSAILVGSSCGDAINLTSDCADAGGSLPDSDLINARAGDIASYFNAGGGILAMSGENNADGDPNSGPDTYYDFVPIGVAGVATNPPYCLTADGISLGFEDQSCPDPAFHNGTRDDINCCPTHNSFAEPPSGSALKVTERDSLGVPETLAASGTISGGGFVNEPTPTGDYYYAEACGFTINGKTDLGTTAADKIDGTPNSDFLKGARGNDKVTGFEDDDCLFGNRGNDKVRGNSGDDIIRAGRGKDKVKGDDGDDDIRLQDGGDKVQAGAGNDHVKAQGRKARRSGIDKIDCGSGNDHAIVDRWDKVKRNCEHVRVVNRHK